MAVAKQFTQLTKITSGSTAASDIKMTDILPMQHTDIAGGVNTLNQVSVAQSMCEPVAVVSGTHDVNGIYSASCVNYPDFSLTYKDKNNIDHYLVGMKVRVVFNAGITYGSTSSSPVTYPSLNISGSGALPMLAQGKTMASGAASAGQTIEFTLIPYGQGYAWDADSNVRESNSDYTVYTDGLKIYHQFSDRPYYWGKYVSSYSQGANYLYYILNNLGLNPTGIGTYRLFIKDTQSTACAEYFVHYQHGNTFTAAVDFELKMHLNAYNIQGTMDFSNISSYSNLQCYVEIISVY